MRRIAGTVSVVVLLLALMLMLAGCGRDQEPVVWTDDEDEEGVHVWVTQDPPRDPTTLDERILRSDVIVRARLRSFSAFSRVYKDEYEHEEIVRGRPTQYVGYSMLTFDVIETLKGTAGDSAVVELETEGFAEYNEASDLFGTYPTAAEAESSVTRWWTTVRDPQWDSREAIIFLLGIDKAMLSVANGRPSSIQYVFAGESVFEANVFGEDDRYSISSKINKVWLPASTSTSGAQSFYLDEPSDGAIDTPTISLAELKARVASVTATVDTSVEGHKECLVRKFRAERAYRDPGQEFYAVFDREMDSGSPAGSALIEIRGKARGSGRYSNNIVEGPNSDLFVVSRNDNDDDPENGYDRKVATLRPLTRGLHVIHHGTQAGWMIPCGYTPKMLNKYNIHVTAPAGTLHEAFFDPVTVGSAIAADATNGVLKPTAFTDANSASATIHRISYDSGTVNITLTPHTGLANHVLDFIALDGSVSLSLDADEATVDAANNTLSWPVSYQPWKDGDKLMLRIYNGPVTPGRR